MTSVKGVSSGINYRCDRRRRKSRRSSPQRFLPVHPLIGKCLWIFRDTAPSRLGGGGTDDLSCHGHHRLIITGLNPVATVDDRIGKRQSRRQELLSLQELADRFFNRDGLEGKVALRVVDGGGKGSGGRCEDLHIRGSYSQRFELLFHLYHISPLFSRMAYDEVGCEPDLSFQLSVDGIEETHEGSQGFEGRFSHQA